MSDRIQRGTRRVLIVNSFTNTGGSQHATLRLARQLKSRGYDTQAWFLYRKGPLFVAPEDAGVPVRVISEKPHLGPVELLRLPGLLWNGLREFRPDAVVSFLPFASVAVQPIALVQGVGARISSHRVPAATYTPMLARIDRMFGRSGVFTDIVCVSQAVQDAFIDYPEAYRRRLSVIHNGIEWKASSLSRSVARRRFGMTRRDLQAVTVGRLSAQKNISLAIETIAATPGTRLTIAGDGPDLAKLQDLVSQRGIGDRVRFLGKQTPEQVGDLLRAADVFLLPSLFEGQSNALLEAMHACLPILTSDIDMQRETLSKEQGGYAGLLAPLEDPAAWAHALARLRDDAELRGKLAAEAYELVNSRFALTRMVDRFETLICRAGIHAEQTSLPSTERTGAFSES